MTVSYIKIIQRVRSRNRRVGVVVVQPRCRTPTLKVNVVEPTYDEIPATPASPSPCLTEKHDVETGWRSLRQRRCSPEIFVFDPPPDKQRGCDGVEGDPYATSVGAFGDTVVGRTVVTSFVQDIKSTNKSQGEIPIYVSPETENKTQAPYAGIPDSPALSIQSSLSEVSDLPSTGDHSLRDRSSPTGTGSNTGNSSTETNLSSGTRTSLDRSSFSSYTSAWVSSSHTTRRRVSLEVPPETFGICNRKLLSTLMESRRSSRTSRSAASDVTGDLSSRRSSVDILSQRRGSYDTIISRPRSASLQSTVGQYLDAGVLQRAYSAETLPGSVGESMGSRASSFNELRPLAQSSQFEERAPSPVTIRTSTDTTVELLSSCAIRRSSQRCRIDDIRVSGSVTAVLFIFLVSWIPLTVVNFMETFTGVAIPHAADRVTVYLVFLQYVGNPLVYGVMNRNFRNGYMKMFCPSDQRSR